MLEPALSVSIHTAKIAHRNAATRRRRPLIELARFDEIPRHSIAVLMHAAKVIDGVAVAQFFSAAIPLECDGVIPRNTGPLIVDIAEDERGFSIAAGKNYSLPDLFNY